VIKLTPQLEIGNRNRNDYGLPRHLDDELNSLRDRVLLLGGEAEAALESAMRALTGRDTELARQVLRTMTEWISWK